MNILYSFHSLLFSDISLVSLVIVRPLLLHLDVEVVDLADGHVALQVLVLVAVQATLLLHKVHLIPLDCLRSSFS